jgi:DNA modification methylase
VTRRNPKASAAAWPADRVERWPVAKLVPNARNARTHSYEQVTQLAASIEEWGWTIPVLVDEAGGIIAGHGRIMAAHRLGIEDVPVMVATGWSDTKKRAYMLADNKLTLNAEWDLDRLAIEIADLRGSDFDISLIGFDESEIDELLKDDGDGLSDPEEAPEPPVEPVSSLGDVWLLGKHRLVCGDCTDPLVVDTALGGVKPHLMVTDPPWGVSYDPDWRNRSSIGWSRSRSIGTVQNDERADWRDAWELFPGSVAYTWCPPGTMQINHYNALISAGFAIRMQIIWAKSHFPIGRGDYHVQHEPCWYAVRKGKTGHWAGDRKQTTLWEIPNRTAFRGKMNGQEDAWSGHSTQKPVECMKRPIENNSSPGQAVYDPFVGSGTTIIAAEMTSRCCHAIEIHPAYVDVSVLRWQNFAGKQATLEATGQTFAKTRRDEDPEQKATRTSAARAYGAEP